MAYDLLASLESKLSSYDTADLADTLELDEKNVLSDKSLVCAAVLAGLMKKCTSEKGVATVGSLIAEAGRETEAETPDGVPQIQSSALPLLVEDGHTALDKIFGSSLNDLMGAIGSYCESSRYQLSKLFSLTGATLVDHLHEIKSDKKLADNEDLAALILRQASTVRSALPDNLYAALGLRNLGSYAEKLVSDRGDRVDKAMNRPERSEIEGLLVRKLLPVGGVVLLLIICWTLFRSCA